MAEISDIERFYLTNHTFNIFVNKGCQTYHKTKSEMLSGAIVKEVFLEMQEGGCNEEHDDSGRL